MTCSHATTTIEEVVAASSANTAHTASDMMTAVIVMTLSTHHTGWVMCT
jgi:hypothetical protein